MEELFDIAAAKAKIQENFDNEGDFSFMKPEELALVIGRLVDVDHAYMVEIGDDTYDEDVIYDRLIAAANETAPQYKTYLMRLVEDYMDFMEQFLVDEGLLEWE
ncbi:MAG: hypothetical protein II155_03555 [Clostridia bacterium]|jgi:hypothetical protein|nr:hypothetical protein [Clostridia bacterium]